MFEVRPVQSAGYPPEKRAQGPECGRDGLREFIVTRKQRATEIHVARVFLAQARANRGRPWGTLMLNAAGRARLRAMQGQTEMFR